MLSTIQTKAANLQNLTNSEFALENPIPPEQQENIKQLISDLQTSIDSSPSQESLTQWKTTVEDAIADGNVTIEEAVDIYQATTNVFVSMGLTTEEMQTIGHDLQNIAEASRFSGDGEDKVLIGTDGNDLLVGQSGSDLLVGTPDNGQGEIDLLIGAGGSDTFVLGDATTVYYDDGLALTAGVDDFAAIADFNAAYDTIQLHGNARDYILGALPSEVQGQGTAIYHIAGGQVPELIAIVAGVEVTDFSQGFAFVG